VRAHHEVGGDVRRGPPVGERLVAIARVPIGVERQRAVGVVTVEAEALDAAARAVVRERGPAVRVVEKHPGIDVRLVVPLIVADLAVVIDHDLGRSPVGHVVAGALEVAAGSHHLAPIAAAALRVGVATGASAAASGSEAAAVRVTVDAVAAGLGVGAVVRVEVERGAGVVVRGVDVADLADVVVRRAIAVDERARAGVLDVRARDPAVDVERLVVGTGVVRVDDVDVGVERLPDEHAVGRSVGLVLLLGVRVVAGPALDVPVAVAVVAVQAGVAEDRRSRTPFVVAGLAQRRQQPRIRGGVDAVTLPAVDDGVVGRIQRECSRCWAEQTDDRRQEQQTRSRRVHRDTSKTLTWRCLLEVT
jgi:hypothetical protein